MDILHNRFTCGCVCRVFSAVFFACALGPLTAHGETQSIIGVWKPVEYMWMEGDTKRVIENPQPGLFIVAGKFYSTTFILSDETRPLEPDGVSREDYTHEQLKSMSVPFVSNAGTYTIEKNRFVYDPVVALNQNFQESGEHKTEFEISNDGKSLTLIVRDESGEIRRRSTWLRLE